jgi:hypothetical protein
VQLDRRGDAVLCHVLQHLKGTQDRCVLCVCCVLCRVYSHVFFFSILKQRNKAHRHTDTHAAKQGTQAHTGTQAHRQHHALSVAIAAGAAAGGEARGAVLCCAVLCCAVLCCVMCVVCCE